MPEQKEGNNVSYPHLENVYNKKVLMVHDRPFIMLAGEVHNSNASSEEYMENIWKWADELGMNSLFLPVTWELIEPEEGKFDFTLVDALIRQARRYHKKIGFLWFGSWKNAQCYYAPSWVKTDTERFKRAQVIKGKQSIIISGGMPYSTLSAFCEETMEADAKAFTKLMEHIYEVDKIENTVICIQVENETGVMGNSREQSDQADEFFYSAVPEKLINWLKEHPETLSKELIEAWDKNAPTGANWELTFGSMAEEVFMAYYTASYVNYVAKAGKEIYSLPMIVNCWLDRGQKPGEYPSGGPVAKVRAIWLCAAPVIDIIAPDIYVPSFCDVCEEYAKDGNPLFIAECATHSYAGLREIYTVGKHHAICYSPFGFEDIGKTFTTMQAMLFGMDTEDEALKTPQDPAEYTKINHILAELVPYLGEKYGSSDLQGAISENSEENILDFGKYRFEIVFDSPFIRRRNGACLILRTNENEFYAVVCGCSFKVDSQKEKYPNVDYILVEEGHLKNGSWNPGRRLNGDEITLMLFEEPTLLKIKLFAY